MDIATDSITEMEEWLSRDVPCGGNNFPIPRDCPDNAAAEWINRHYDNCPQAPTPRRNLKCGNCHAEWYLAVEPRISCHCGLVQAAQDWYVPL